METNAYDLFISYTWADEDKAAATQIERRLRRFHWLFRGKRKILVYRDETSMEAASSLGPALEKRIREAGLFLLICSQDSATGSRWVPREVEYWLNSSKDSLSRTVFATLQGDRLEDGILPEPMRDAISCSGTPLEDYLVLPLGPSASGHLSTRLKKRHYRRKVACQLAARIWDVKPQKTCRIDLAAKVVSGVAVLGVFAALVSILIVFLANRSEVDQQLKALLAENPVQDDVDFTNSRLVDFGSLKNSFAGATFDRSEIVKTNFDRNQLREASFHDATLSDVRFEAVTAIDASFSCPEDDLVTVCRGAMMRDVIFHRESKLIDVNFNHTRLDDVTFEGVDLHDSTFVGAVGSGVTFKSVDLKGVNMTQATFEDVTFDRICYDEDTSWPLNMVYPLPPNIRLACRLGG